jgi:hypothetical protein
MAIKVTLVSDNKSRVSINSPDRRYIKTVAVAPDISGVHVLGDLEDVDATDPDNNETLVYDEVSGKYIIKTLPVVDGGEF